MPRALRLTFVYSSQMADFTSIYYARDSSTETLVSNRTMQFNHLQLFSSSRQNNTMSKIIFYAGKYFCMLIGVNPGAWGLPRPLRFLVRSVPPHWREDKTGPMHAIAECRVSTVSPSVFKPD
jgi:hypothetical protein